MEKNYWKECCLLLIGIILGCLYQKHFEVSSIKEVTTIERDTIIKHDTIYAKFVAPPLNKHSVLAELKKQNVPHAHIVLAQSIHETGNYKSKLCKTHNNIFGMKKGNQYKKYNDYIECIEDYKKLISSRYKKGEDYYQFLSRIGYASDPEYNEKLKKIIQKV